MGFCFFVCMKEAAPHEADAFSAWHEEQTSLDRESGITYDDISICPEELKRWYEVMLSHFPAMNGRDAESSQLAYTMMLGDIPFVQARLEAHLTNYAVKSNLIFGECSWVLAKEVYELAQQIETDITLGIDNHVASTPQHVRGNDASAQPYYNLQGLRVLNPQHGHIYIKGGRKILY